MTRACSLSQDHICPIYWNSSQISQQSQQSHSKKTAVGLVLLTRILAIFISSIWSIVGKKLKIANLLFHSQFQGDVVLNKPIDQIHQCRPSCNICCRISICSHPFRSSILAKKLDKSICDLRNLWFIFFTDIHPCMSRLMTKPTKWHVRPSKTDQPGHLPSLIRAFAVCMKKAWVLSYPFSAQRRLWSDWADVSSIVAPFGWMTYLE